MFFLKTEVQDKELVKNGANYINTNAIQHVPLLKDGTDLDW